MIMVLQDLDHVELLTTEAIIEGGQEANDLLSIFLSGNGLLKLKRGNQDLFSTVLPNPTPGITITLENVPSYTISGTSTSSDGAIQSVFSTSGIGTQNHSAISFTFNSSAVIYPRLSSF